MHVTLCSCCEVEGCAFRYCLSLFTPAHVILGVKIYTFHVEPQLSPRHSRVKDTLLDSYNLADLPGFF